jgi:hypothetical protein
MHNRLSCVCNSLICIANLKTKKHYGDVERHPSKNLDAVPMIIYSNLEICEKHIPNVGLIGDNLYVSDRSSNLLNFLNLP